MRSIQVNELGAEDDFESAREKKKQTKKTSPPPMYDNRVPEHLRKSAKWQKLQAMNNDLKTVSSSVYRFDDFLRKVSKKMKIKDLKTIKEHSFK